MKKLLLYFVLTLVLVVLAACSNSNNSISGHDMSNMDMGDKKTTESTTSKNNDNSDLPLTTAIMELSGATINLTAKEAVNQFDSQHKFTVWTFNGSVPGSLIKVKQGEKVTVKLKNELSEPVTIHWHGLPVPNRQDGIPSVTQNAVKPGETYTYQFVATLPGTYWYHSHQDSVNQLDKGLYGALIVEGKNEEKVDKEYGENTKSTFTLKQKYNVEYTMELNTGMDKNGMVYTINGKTFPNTDPINVKKGDLVKVTLKNLSDAADHPIHLHGHTFQVLSKNGQPLSGSPILKDTLNLKPGDVYEVAFRADNPGDWMFHCHDLHHASAGMVTELKYEGYTPSFQIDPYAGNKPE